MTIFQKVTNGAKYVLFCLLLLASFNSNAFAFNCQLANQIAPKIPVAECNAILDLFDKTGGENWTAQAKAGWLTNSSICTWQGLTCANGHITEIFLTNLTGYIPSSIGTFPELIELRLSDSYYLTGTIPYTIGNLTKLKRLSLARTQLSGDLPSEIGNLTNLETLDLSEANFSKLPSTIGNLSNLEWVDFSRNFTGTIPSSIGNLTKLQYFRAYSSHFSGSLPYTIGNLTALRGLYLPANDLSGPIPSEIGNLTNLLHLQLDDNTGMSGNIPDSIGNLSQLTSLGLSLNSFTGEIPSSIGNLHSIQELNLSGNELSCEIPTSITQLGDTLTQLHLTGNHLFSGNDTVLNFLQTHDSGWYEEQELSAKNISGCSSEIARNSNSCASISTSNDLDSDGDGLADFCDTDDDNDGVMDSTELAYGSNPKDRGSFKQILGTTVCSEWNGFLGNMLNIMEHVNVSNGPLYLTNSIFDIQGNKLDTLKVNQFLAFDSQVDVLVHDRSGRIANSYGKVCTTYSGEAGIKGSDQDGALDGRMVYYKPDPGVANGYEFAFAMPFSNGIAGKQFVTFNTYQPSLNWQDVDNGVANWIQLTNLEDSEQRGTLKFYDMAGSTIGSQTVKLAPGGRTDFSGHQFGPSLVGHIEWAPNSDTASFRLRNVRYFYASKGMAGNKFTSAFQLEGARGNGNILNVPLDTRDGSSIIEISNVTDKKVITNVKIYTAAGNLLFNTNVSLNAHASHHLIADSILSQAQGIALIDADTPSGIIATVMQYGRDSYARLKYLYGIQAIEPYGSLHNAWSATIKGSFNTYLKQGCNLLITNPTELPKSPVVWYSSKNGYSGYKEVTIPAHGMLDVDICSEAPDDIYGIVGINLENGSTRYEKDLTATLVRKGENDQYRFPTPVR
jgi:Leucine-rich repeat (LRR) protein